MVLIERSVETPRSSSIAARVWQGRPRGGLVGVLTSKRSQINDVQYPRVSNRILKGTSHEEVVNDESNEAMLIFELMACRDIQISCITARVWQSHLRHADQRKVSSV
jgi:hypothetical protein